MNAVLGVILCTQDNRGAMVKQCLVKGCKNRHDGSGRYRFFCIPAPPRQPFKELHELWAKRHRRWLEAAGYDAATFELKQHHRICSKHFVSGSWWMFQCTYYNFNEMVV